MKKRTRKRTTKKTARKAAPKRRAVKRTAKKAPRRAAKRTAKPKQETNPFPLGKRVRVKAIRIVKRGGKKLLQVFR